MTDYEKLIDIVEEIDVLISDRVTSSDPCFEAWHTKTERFLIKYFGDDSLEHAKFKDTSFSLMIWTSETTESDSVRACRRGLETTKAVLNTYLEEMEEGTCVTKLSKPVISDLSFKKIFIVHGHDGELKQSVARIIEKQDIEAIILSEQANQGRTIIEKFEKYSDVNGAICLFTSDDIGRGKKDEIDNARARQNVVLETGYFMGKLGRDHVVLLADNGIEIPSDLSGVVYTNTEKWEIDLLKEMKAMGYTIDFNRLF